MTSLSLSELNSLVRQALELTMPDTFWVRAEIAELRVAVNGHCYMELTEHNEQSGQMCAKAHANCWRNTYAFLRPRFERESGQRLEAGLQVLLEVQVTFHAQYGYSLTVCDIDPTYTMGEAARRRREILRQLDEDGVADMNKSLPLPCPIQRVAIISSPTAAGYGDFCNQIQQSGLPFLTKLYPATMQGEQVESSIIAALDEIARDFEQWDVVVIIRGGGATTDLNGYESYALAANVAQFPLPIITGIGHERDETVIDLIANTRLKTPTAVAAFLIDQWQEQIEHLHDIEQRLSIATRRYLADTRLALQAYDSRLTRSGNAYLFQAHRSLTAITPTLATACARLLSQQNSKQETTRLRFKAALLHQLTNATHKLDIISKSLTLADPKQILRQGYSITRVNGKAVKSSTHITPGDTITTTFMDGKAISTISTVHHNNLKK